MQKYISKTPVTTSAFSLKPENCSFDSATVDSGYKESLGTAKKFLVTGVWLVRILIKKILYPHLARFRF